MGTGIDTLAAPLAMAPIGHYHCKRNHLGQHDHIHQYSSSLEPPALVLDNTSCPIHM
jgi:hypothetical protein